MKTAFITLLLLYLPIVSAASRDPHRSRPSSHHQRRTRNFHADPYTPSTPSTPSLYFRDSFGDQPRPLHRRSEPGAAIAKIYTAVTDKVFDYVIAGGGTAGLALAGRLSEDPDVTVAVIEAGHSGYNSDSELLVSSNAYFKSSVGSDLDWQHETALQSKLQDESGNARTASWPRGKVLGGSSAINGLYYSTDFSANQIKELDSSIKNQTKYVGDNGPVGVTYPGVSYQPVADWVPTLAALGIDHAESPYNGDNQGAFIATSTINPKTWERSFSCNAYIDPIVNKRKNLVVLPNQTVLARKIGQTKPLSSLVKAEAAPGAEVDSDEEWDKFVAKTVQTEYHPSSTCSMLDEGDGGVVDEELRVYGTSNVRVMDASVVPISLSSHLMSATYAIAETAAELIKSCPYEVVDECDWDGEGEDEEISASADGAEEEDCEDEE
ncbi:hypothetical protein NDA18_005001 [Ustilago nuda]|nr:hypothetical protein NDA18_005001 [Ustilago nuda]